MEHLLQAGIVNLLLKVYILQSFASISPLPLKLALIAR